MGRLEKIISWCIGAIIVALIALLAASLCGCSSRPMFGGSHQDFVTMRWSPTFEVDDLKDGLFPNRSDRVGERVYTWRSRVGVRRKWDSGAELYVRGGPENRHVGAVEVGAELPVGR